MRNKHGFTLIEMVVCIGLLAMLGLFMVTSYTAISQMNAEVFKEREYIQESLYKFYGNKEGLENYGEVDISISLGTNSKCAVLRDPNNGLLALGNCS